MNLWLSLNKALTLFPGKEALIDGSKRFTYKQFGARVAGLIAALHSLGLKKGSVVSVAAPNCHEYMEIYYACGIAGIVLSPLNYRLSVREIAAILEDSESGALLVHSDFVDKVAGLLSDCTSVKTVICFGEGARPENKHLEYETLVNTKNDIQFDRLPQLKADDLAHLYYTSGTTGKPKGVMLTQGNVTFNALAVIADLGLFEKDTWLHAAPMFHLADAWSTFAITWAGGKHVFIPYFQSASALQSIEKEGVTASVLVPTMLNAMLHDSEIDKYNYSSMRMVLTGGSPIAPDVVREAINKFGCEYVQLYGMTETSPFLTLSRPKADQLTGDADGELNTRSRTGRPYIGAEVKVIRTDGTEVEHNDLEVGEIVARGPSIFTGYWKQPDATAQTLKDGWIHTGDLAVVDSEGFINIVDRAKDMIITGGENVYSTEVEFILHEHPGVMECAVFGIPDGTWGEAVKAVVVQRNGQSLKEADLVQFLREKLAHYKVPRSIDFVSELPKTGSGKIYKKGLREQYWREREKAVN